MPTVATRGSFDAPYDISPPQDMPIAATSSTFTLSWKRLLGSAASFSSQSIAAIRSVPFTIALPAPGPGRPGAPAPGGGPPARAPPAPGPPCGGPPALAPPGPPAPRAAGPFGPPAPAPRAPGGPSAITTKPCDAISDRNSGNMRPFFAQPPSPQTTTGWRAIVSSAGR